MNVLLLINTLAYVLADDGDSGAAAAAPLILALSGFIFYGVMYSRYRNADKRHVHEKETSAAIANLERTDSFIKSRKGLSNAKLNGANHARVEGAHNVRGESKLTNMIRQEIGR